MSQTVMTPTYTGSVKTVYRDAQCPHVNYFAFSDDYSVFDWGKMPDTIAHKGRSLAILGGALFKELSQGEHWQALAHQPILKHFNPDFLNLLFSSTTYQQLCQQGLRHHFLGWCTKEAHPLELSDLAMSASAPLMQVAAIAIHPPEPFTADQQTLYRYPAVVNGQPRLIPLEVVFRFGMTEGSSLPSRLQSNPNYFAELGLTERPQTNQPFSRPVVEFFTKLEPKDRFVSYQEAFLLAGISPAEFESLIQTTLFCALWLYHRFDQCGMTLWDGKFEFAWTPDGIQLVDSIGPDELRLTKGGVSLSKEVLRQVYRTTPDLADWPRAVQKAKDLAASLPGTDWQALCRNQLGQSPKPLPPEWKLVVDSLYGALTNTIVGQNVVACDLTLDDVIAHIQQFSQPVAVRGAG
jgi:phosphoribosylaminoimidazole-succinocarboxamide synthase